MEENEDLGLKGIFECGYREPSTIKFFSWNWWINDSFKCNYYKNNVTFHGPQIYLSGPIHQLPYPSLLASNFDSIDFQYPLQYLTCRLPQNDHKITKMTDYVLDILESDFSMNNQHNGGGGGGNNGGNRFSRHHSRRYHHHHHHHHNDDELQMEVNDMKIKFSVKGVFISKPYNQSSFNSDGSFTINLHCNWNIDCIEQEAAYNVIILPSHYKNRKRCKELEVEHYIHPSMNDENDIHGELRIYPEKTDKDREKERERQERNHLLH